MFALMNPDEIASVLEAAGFERFAIEPIAPTIRLGGGGTLDESIEFLLGTGIARGLLDRLEGGQRAAALHSVRMSLRDRYVAGDGVRLGTGAWLVTAHA